MVNWFGAQLADTIDRSPKVYVMLAILRKNKVALLLSLLYFVPGMIWVFLSDSLLFTTPRSLEAERVMQIDKIKDASFVVAVSISFFITIHLSRKKLVKTRLEYQNLFDQNPNPMWIYELETLKFMTVNNAAIEQYGYTREEFLGMTLADIRPPSDEPLLKEFVSSYASEKRRSVWTHLKKSGEMVVAEILADDITFFGKRCRLVCAADITEKIKRDSDINRLSLVAKNATNSVIITDKEARIEWVNDAFTSLTGYTFEEAVGRRPSEFLHGPETSKHTLDEIFACMQEKKPYSGEILNYRKDGSVFWLRLTVSPVITNGRLSNYITVQTDITAIKEQNKRLREIAYTASHGFRKPLANVLGLLELFTDETTDKQIIADLKKCAKELDREVRFIVEKTKLINPN